MTSEEILTEVKKMRSELKDHRDLMSPLMDGEAVMREAINDIRLKTGALLEIPSITNELRSLNGNVAQDRKLLTWIVAGQFLLNALITIVILAGWTGYSFEIHRGGVNFDLPNQAEISVETTTDE